VRRGLTDFLDTARVEQSVERTGGSLAVRIGAFSQTFGFGFLSFGYEQRYFAAGAPRNICHPIGGTDALECAEHVLGAPAQRIGAVIHGEVRRYLGSSLALSPSVSYNFKNEVTSIAVPMYFLRNTEGGLTGGIRGSWRSDTESVSLVVFIGTSFSLQ
jgi:hypothetical protein